MDDVVIIGGGIIGTAQLIFYLKKVEKLKLLKETQLIKKHLFHYHLVDLEDNFFKKKIFY